MEDSPKLDQHDGRDELNLAELPIALLADRAPAGRKTLEFAGAGGRLTVTGADAWGLPTALDTDVIVGLLQLTRAKNGFTDPTVPFTPHQLISLMGWPNQGHYYTRLRDSLNRWVGTTLRYDRAWFDNSVKGRVDATFHILESVVIFDAEIKRNCRARQQPLPLSRFTWNRIFFDSCRADNLKRLDIGIYFGLRSAVSKQLYRFLDKRFWVRPSWTFDLRVLAFDHVGLSRNYTAAKIKEKLAPALAELESIRFLRPAQAGGRYIAGPGRGDWSIKLDRVREKTAIAPRPGEARRDTPLFDALGPGED